MVDIYEMMKGISDQGQVGYEQGRQRRDDMRNDSARKLFGVAAQGNKSALTQLYGVDPALALKVKQSNEDDRVKGAQFMHRAATVLKSAPDDQKPIVYSRLIQEAKNNPNVAEFTQGLPDQYDPSIMQHVDGLIGMAGMYEDQPAQGQETWMNGGNGTMISNRGNSKPIEGYVQRPVGGARGGSSLSNLPRKLSDDEIAAQANQMVKSGMPDEQIQNWIVAQQSMPDVQMSGVQLNNKPPKLSAIEQRVNLARKLGASEDEIKAIVLGGKGGGKAAGTGGAPASPKVTEDQSKAANWYASSQNALNNLNAALKEDPQALYPGITETYIPNNEAKQRSMSPARQKAAHAFNTMKMDFLHAATGAGFSIQEAQDEWTNLAPQRGDGDALAKQKLDQILVKIEAMGQRAGPALRAPNSPNANDANMTLPKMDSGPKPGTVEGGYRFNGGNPADPKSWVKI